MTEGLSKAIDNFNHLPAIYFNAKLPDAPAIKEAASVIAQTFLTIGEPAIFDLNRSQQAIWSYLETDSLHQLKGRELKDLPWCLFGGERPLASDSGFLQALEVIIRQKGNRSFMKSLMINYLKHFSSGSEETRRLAKIIHKYRHLLSVQWVGLCNKFGLLEPEVAARKIATIAMQTTEPSPLQHLRNAGFPEMVLYTGSVEKAFLFALHSFKDSFAILKDKDAHDYLDKILLWAQPHGDLAYKNQKHELINALLEPWQEKNPGPELQKKIQSFLLQHFNDPRINRSKWFGASENSQLVIKKWLTRVALKEFINVVSQTANQDWVYRRNFWEAYLNRAVIDEAWVAFAPQALSLARHAFENNTGFAQLLTASGNIQHNHSALIMKIGGLTIVDWSHTPGGCRIWREGNLKAPKLYEPKYNKKDLQKVQNASSDFNTSHANSAGKHWQNKVARYIAEHTGIRVMRSEY